MSILICLLLLAAPTLARDDYGGAAVKTLHRVVDGDTYLVSLWGWPDVVGDSVYVRVAGVDTPEMRGATAVQGRQARDFAADILRRGPIHLHCIRRDKYFRLIAEVRVDSVNVGAELLKAGLARPYSGGKK